MSPRNAAKTKADGKFYLQETHRDLARKYRNVSSKVDAIWNKFTPKQREHATTKSVANGKVLKHCQDRSLGNIYKIIPEYNLHDMASKPEHFLDILKFRASTRLVDQLYVGVNGEPGDREVMEKSGMRYEQASSEEKTFFMEGELYGQSFTPTGGVFPALPEEDARLFIIPRSLGELIVARQQFLLQYLNNLVEDVMGMGSETRNTNPPERRANEALVTAISNLNIQPEPLKSSLPEVLGQAMESKAALEDYLFLLRTEPVVLGQAVMTAYWSRAELVADDRGRVVPAFGDHYFSAAFFDSVLTAVEAIAIWDYIVNLLQLLGGSSDKVQRPLILQELSNACHLEYRRAQESFKRKIAPPFAVAGKSFKRVNNASNAPKIIMKGHPADYTVSDPQLHYMLRLCHPDTSPEAAVQWIQKLDEHNALYAEDRNKLGEAEMAALGDIAIIVSFIHITSTAIPMTPLSRKSGLLFATRSSKLETKLNDLKPKADFGDFLVPIHNLLEPGMATGALAALDNFVLQEIGVMLSSLFEDTVQDSLDDLAKMCAEAKARREKVDAQTTYVPFPMETQSSGDARRDDKRAKEKTRSSASTAYTITAPPEVPQIVITEPAKQFHVKASTASLFTTLFSRSEARGALAWTNFESAMADLGFSVTPKGGSVYAFNPPDSMETRPITLHRPHASEIEGHKLLIISRRLQRAFGWTEKSFVVV